MTRLKQRLTTGVLLTLIAFQGITAIKADEWDIAFEEIPIEESESGDRPWRLTSAEASYISRRQNNSGTEVDYPLDWQVGKFTTGFLMKTHLSEKTRLVADFELLITNEGHAKALDSGQSFQTISDHLAYVYPLINEVVYQHELSESVFFEVGVLKTGFGNSLYFNPIDFTERYHRDGHLYDTRSLPGFRLSVSGDRVNTTLDLIPGLTDFMGSGVMVSRFFQLGKTNPLAVVQTVLYLGSGRLAILGFLESKDTGDGSGYYSGLGLEAQYPLTDSTTFNAQLLKSNGDAPYTITEVNQTPYFAYLDTASKNISTADWQIQFDTRWSDRVLSTLGYHFNGQGLSQNDRLKLKKIWHSITTQSASVDRDTMISSLQGVRLSPLLTMARLVFFNISLLDFVDGWTGNLFGMISPEDGSFSIATSIQWKMNEEFSISASVNPVFGKRNSFFGAGYADLNWGIGFKAEFD